MVNPVKNQTSRLSRRSPKKKITKEVDLRVNKAVGKSKSFLLGKSGNSLKPAQEVAARQAYLAAVKASSAARQKAFATQKAAVKAQKAAFLAQRAHMAQQSAAAKRALAAEKAKKEAEKAAKKASTLHRFAKIKVYVTKPQEKKRSDLLKKYGPASKKKKYP